MNEMFWLFYASAIFRHAARYTPQNKLRLKKK